MSGENYSQSANGAVNYVREGTNLCILATRFGHMECWILARGGSFYLWRRSTELRNRHELRSAMLLLFVHLRHNLEVFLFKSGHGFNVT